MKPFSRILLAVSAALLLAAPIGARAETLYGAIATKATTSDLLILNPANGALIGTVGPIGYAVTGLAVHPATGVLYGAVSNNSAAGKRSLITINKQTGAGTLVGAFGPTPGDSSCLIGLSDLTFNANGTLFGWNENCDDNLYSVNLATGAATKIGNSGLSTYGSGIAVSPGGTMYLAGDGADGSLYAINQATGTGTIAATLTGAPVPTDASIAALAYNAAGTLYGVWLDSGGTPRTSHLLIINPATGATTNLGQSVTQLDAIAFDNSAPVFIPTVVPTLNEWALMLLMAMLAASAVLLLRRRR